MDKNTKTQGNLIVLDKLLCEEVTLESICGFLIATKQITLETQEVIDVVMHLKNLKEELSPVCCPAALLF